MGMATAPEPGVRRCLTTHFTTVRLSVAKASVQNDGTGDRFYGPTRGDLIEVELSAAQFAELLTSMNQGSGVPCTVRRLNDKQMEDPPELPMESEKIRVNFTDRVKSLGKKYRDFQDVAATILQPDRKAQLALKLEDRLQILSMLGAAANTFASDAPFFLELFQESMGKVTSAAKAEADAFLTAAITRLGIQGLDRIKALTAGDEADIGG